jgi:hypothetical protein
MAWNNSIGRSLSGRLLAPTPSSDAQIQIDDQEALQAPELHSAVHHAYR